MLLSGITKMYYDLTFKRRNKKLNLKVTWLLSIHTLIKIFLFKVFLSIKIHFDVSLFCEIGNLYINDAMILWIFLPTAWKVSKYGVFSGSYFPVFGLNTDQKKLRIWTLKGQASELYNYLQDDTVSPKKCTTLKT